MNRNEDRRPVFRHHFVSGYLRQRFFGFWHSNLGAGSRTHDHDHGQIPTTSASDRVLTSGWQTAVGLKAAQQAFSPSCNKGKRSFMIYATLRVRRWVNQSIIGNSSQAPRFRWDEAQLQCGSSVKPVSVSADPILLYRFLDQNHLRPRFPTGVRNRGRSVTRITFEDRTDLTKAEYWDPVPLVWRGFRQGRLQQCGPIGPVASTDVQRLFFTCRHGSGAE